jgi:hypothetical protein
MIDRANEGDVVLPIAHQDEGDFEPAQIDVGISKRDWFAAMAMQGMVVGSRDSTESMHPTTALEIARAAYHYADIMIRTSKETPLIGHPDE